MSIRELTFPIDSSNEEVLTIDDDRVCIINDPLRWQILENVGAQKTIAELSDILNVTDARIVYHVTRLVETKVLHLEKEGSDARKWYCWPLIKKLRIDTSVAEKKDLSEAIPDHVASDFNQAFRELNEGLFGATSQVSVNHNRSRLSKEQASEFSRRLLALIEEYFPPGKGDQTGIKYGFYGILTPIDLHPIGDAEAD